MSITYEAIYNGSFMKTEEIPEELLRLKKAVESYLVVSLEDRGRVANSWLYDNPQAETKLAITESLGPKKTLAVTVMYPADCSDLPKDITEKFKLTKKVA
jgi:hypothetical protein